MIANTASMDAATIREHERTAKRKKREDARDIPIRSLTPQQKRRRTILEKSDEKWLRHFFPEFWYEFTEQQLEMIGAVRHAIEHGGDQAIAASRGEGKTTIVERLLIKYTLQGVINFSVLFAATGVAAENSLDSIKTDLQYNEQLQELYPEVCEPIIALENTPQRAHFMTCSGKRHDNGKPYEKAEAKFTWCGNKIILPAVPGSPSESAIITTRGLDAAVRGLKIRGKRPQLAVIDDPDTEDTARSEEQAAKLEDRIDKGIGGLGGQQRGIARVMLTTLQSRTSASYKFTDPEQKPSWHGKRFRYLVTPPKREDLWVEYVTQRKADLQSGDKWGREAHQFYLDNKELMHEGARVANPNRFDPTIAPDGLPVEVSSLQHYYNEVARIGPAAVATELDNDPPEDEGIVESRISAYRVQRQVSGYPRNVVPEDCVRITQGIDVRKTALHWVIRGWRPDATGFVLDYGVHEVRGTVYGSDDGLDIAIRRAILERAEDTKATTILASDGSSREVDATLIDAGYRTDAVYAATAEIGTGFHPVMGFGKSAGCVRVSFAETQRITADKRPGDGWFLSRKGKIWLVCADADRWKAWEHDRWMTAQGEPGSLQMFGEPGQGQRLSDDERGHHAYAHHITAEIEVEEPVKGVLKRYWKAKRKNNHWLDASYYSNVAASMLGVRLEMRNTSRAVTLGGKPRKSLKEMSLG